MPVEVTRTIENPFEAQRRERLKWLREFCSKNVGANYSAINGMLQQKFGITGKTAKGYIEAIANGSEYYFNTKNQLERVSASAKSSE